LALPAPWAVCRAFKLDLQPDFTAVWYCRQQGTGQGLPLAISSAGAAHSLYALHMQNRQT
jgi:hypothetical protein